MAANRFEADHLALQPSANSCQKDSHARGRAIAHFHQFCAGDKCLLSIALDRPYQRRATQPSETWKYLMFNDPQTNAAAIAFVGLLISVTSSFFVARLAAKNEREKIKQQLHNVYSERIVAERIRSYPELYRLISGFLKRIYDRSFAEEGRLSQLRDAVYQWDEEHAIFMGSHTQHDMHLFRKALDSFCASFDDSKREYTPAELEELWKSMTRLELSLKADIGVFVLDEYDRKATFVNYGSLMDHMKVK